MALPDNKLFVAFPPQILFRDKDSGSPLSAGVVYFYKDDDRSTLKAIYKQVRLADNTYNFVQINNPVTLTSIGTFADDDGNDILVYTFPYEGTPGAPGEIELYYLKVYSAGGSASGVFQFDREAYPPNITAILNDENFQASENQITNPQFVDILFDVDPFALTYTYQASGTQTTAIAPGWSLITTGSGAVTLKQVPTSDNTNVSSNPPYALQVQTGGTISNVILRQRLAASPALFYRSAINGRLTARGITPKAVTFSMEFKPSSGTQYTIFEDSLTSDNGLFTELGKTIPTGDASDTQNTDLAPAGYVDIDITWTPLTTIQITSIQLTTVKDEATEVQYLQQSTAQQENRLFYYYNPLLQYKPIPSLLTGWDFPLNPAQFSNTASYTMNTTKAYGWDQTITQSLVGNIAVARNGVTSGFQATTANNLEAFYMLQFLTGAQAKKIIGTPLSVNIDAFRTVAGGAVNVSVNLYRATSASSFPAIATALGTMSAPTATTAATFTLTASVIADGWTEIPRSGLGQAIGTLSTITTNADINNTTDLRFNGWEMTAEADISNTDKFAIVVTFSVPTTATVIIVNSISLVPGDIATRPAPQAADEVLRECQSYYETSFLPTQTKPQATTTGILISPQVVYKQYRSASNSDLNIMTASEFMIRWNVTKISSPSVTLYSGTSTTANAIQSIMRTLVTTTTGEHSTGTWASIDTNINRALYNIPVTSVTLLSQSQSIGTSADPFTAYIQHHYIADARLGR